jgi:hypothetical protein
VGFPFAELMPDKHACLALLEATYRDGQSRTYADQQTAEAG